MSCGMPVIMRLKKASMSADGKARDDESAEMPMLSLWKQTHRVSKTIHRSKVLRLFVPKKHRLRHEIQR